MWQGGALRCPLVGVVVSSRALGADASLTEKPGAAMATSAAGAAFEAAAVETAVAIDAVTAAEGSSADCRALGIGRTGSAEGDISTAETATDRATDAPTTVEPATTLGPSGAATPFVAATVQRTIAGDSVVIAEDGSAHLATFAGMGALPAESDGPAAATRGSADSVRAEEATAANGVPITPAAVVVTAVEGAIGVDPV